MITAKDSNEQDRWARNVMVTCSSGVLEDFSCRANFPGQSSRERRVSACIDVGSHTRAHDEED